ncbi:extracellular solute-binding protein [Paenibacillus sp. FA6]|uniref:extracellular solute-binding protein n=1 Tax=Paenibacillus sp. FA6 TaxID=3413029 RepID=UPI003F659A2E
MNKFKKSLTSIVAIPLVLALTAGCGGTKSESSTTPATSSDASAPTSDVSKADPTPIKIFMAGGSKFQDGEDINNNPWTKLIEQENNVDLQIEYGPATSDEYMNKLTLKFASNDIPDLFFTAASNQKWITENAALGALKPLDEYIDKYPTLKDAVYPTAWEAAKYDGKTYAIPVLGDGNKATDNVYIRKDWLDKLKLEVPTTLEELEKVSTAFRDQDPDGNGKNDTYGLVAYDNMMGWSFLYGAFGVIPGYYLEKDGKLVPADTQPEMKEALAYINKLYTSKLLDNEWPVMKVKNYQERVSNSQVGIYEGSWAATRSEINTNKQNDPNAEWIMIQPPAGPAGKHGVAGGADYKSFIMISSKAKNEDAILSMLQWMANPDNLDKFVFGFDDLGEGLMYDMVDGKYALNFENHNKYGYRQQLMFMQPKELNKKKMEALGSDFNLTGTIENSVKYGIPNLFTGAPGEAMAENKSKLEQMRTEVFTKIIVGHVPIDAFDTFVKDYNAKGGDQITEEVNAWYKSK